MLFVLGEWSNDLDGVRVARVAGFGDLFVVVLFVGLFLAADEGLGGLSGFRVGGSIIIMGF